MSEDIRKMINKVMNVKKSVNENNTDGYDMTDISQMNEISPKLRNDTISRMKDKGMDKRAEKWTQVYVDKDLKDFKGQNIFDDKLIIYAFHIDDSKNRRGDANKSLVITYGSPRSQQYNTTQGTIAYYFDRDEYSINHEITRKTARTLSKIATIMNDETKYSNGIDDFKIKGW